MTMNVNIAHHGHDQYVTTVITEDQVYDGEAKAMSSEWREVDRFTLMAGQHRTVFLTSTRRVRLEEAKAE